MHVVIKLNKFKMKYSEEGIIMAKLVIGNKYELKVLDYEVVTLVGFTCDGILIVHSPIYGELHTFPNDLKEVKGIA